jgi:hypothetical protein
MNQILRIHTLHSIKDLLKYKSFFLLILFLFFFDRFIHFDIGGNNWIPSWHEFIETTDKLAIYVFEELPGYLFQFLFNWRTMAILAGLFILKQLISLWPSSDMRRMHRFERRGFGVVKALLTLRWHQIAWDAMAVGILCSTLGGWILCWYVLCRIAWQCSPSTIWLWVLVALFLSATPIALAGFSYSSKLAILSRGNFNRKLQLFLKLFTCRRIFLNSWVFYLLRQLVEVVFVVVLPAAILITVPLPWLRILLAGFLAAPVYSFLKMASFKFFLHIYSPFPEVKKEYADYYRSVDQTNFGVKTKTS